MTQTQIVKRTKTQRLTQRHANRPSVTHVQSERDKNTQKKFRHTNTESQTHKTQRQTQRYINRRTVKQEC